MTAPAPTKPKRVRYRDPTTPMDMDAARRALARDDAERLAGPRAPACRCPRPWPQADAGELTCAKCGRWMNGV